MTESWKRKVLNNYGQGFIYSLLAERASTLAGAALRMSNMTMQNRATTFTENESALMRALAEAELVIDLVSNTVFDFSQDQKVGDMYTEAEQNLIDELLEDEDS